MTDKEAQERVLNEYTKLQKQLIAMANELFTPTNPYTGFVLINADDCILNATKGTCAQTIFEYKVNLNAVGACIDVKVFLHGKRDKMLEVPHQNIGKLTFELNEVIDATIEKYTAKKK